MKSAILVLMLLGLAVQDSPFNIYSVHLQHVALTGACAVNDLDQFGNRAYRFRGARMYPFDEPLTLRDGRAVERNPDGSIEWESFLARPASIQLGDAPAVILEIGAAHLGGTGSVAYLLVGRCRPNALEIVLEASGPLKDSTYSESDGLKISHYVWLPNDCHACPSREITEWYRWDSRRDRFVLVDRSERQVER
jgi:hypothetical protein